MFDRGSETSIDVSIVQFSIENQKLRITVDNGSNSLCFWPRHLLKELFSKSIESIHQFLSPTDAILIFIASLHFIDIVLKICTIKVRQVSSNCIRDLCFLQ